MQVVPQQYQVMDPALNSALNCHNELRRKHGVPPLKLDTKLCELARKFAKARVLGQRTPSTSELGRNEYQITGEDVQEYEDQVAREAVQVWFAHLADYNWETPSESSWNAFEASQIIWKSTTLLGIGIATEGEDTVLIALYSPPGNSSADDQVYRKNVFQSSV